VAEAHQASAAVEDALDDLCGVAVALHLLEHRQDSRRSTAVEWSRHRADCSRQARRDVGAGGGDDASGERRCVHAVLGAGDPVRVDGGDVRGIGLAAPTRHEPLDDRRAVVDASLRHGRDADPARRLGHVRQRHHGDSSELVASLLLGDVEQRLVAPQW